MLVLLGFVPIDCRVSILEITIMAWGFIPHNSTWDPLGDGLRLDRLSDLDIEASGLDAFRFFRDVCIYIYIHIYVYIIFSYIYICVAWTFRVYLAILVGLVFKLQQHHGDKDDDDRV